MRSDKANKIYLQILNFGCPAPRNKGHPNKGVHRVLCIKNETGFFKLCDNITDNYAIKYALEWVLFRKNRSIFDRNKI